MLSGWRRGVESIESFIPDGHVVLYPTEEGQSLFSHTLAPIEDIPHDRGIQRGNLAKKRVVKCDLNDFREIYKAIEK